MDQAARVAALIEPSLEAMGYEVVRVLIMGKSTPILQVMAERQDGAEMTVDDCADISRSLSALLDVEDPIDGAYTLEVSSPGIDRPLTRPKDFDRFAGNLAKVELSEALDGRRRFQGTLLGLRDGDIAIRVDSDDLVLPMRLMAKAKLVLTDALLEAARARQEERN